MSVSTGTTLLPNKLTIPGPGWVPHQCGGWPVSEGVCSLYLASSSSFWGQPWLPLVVMAEGQEGEHKRTSKQQASVTPAESTGLHGGPGSALCLCVCAH